MATKIRGATALTGGGAGAVDAISGAVLADGDIVVAVYDGQVYTYVVDADSGLAESSPHIIAPDVSAGDKRLILQSMSDEIDVLAIYGDGVNRTRTAIEAAKTALGVVNKYTFLIRRGTWTIDDDLTITSNLTLKVVPGALLQIAAGKTLTIGGPFEAGLYQVFSGDGSVRFTTGVVREVIPQWFGALGDNSHNDGPAIQAAINSLTGVSGVVFLPSGRYIATAQLTGIHDITIKGVGIWNNVGSTIGSAIIGKHNDNAVLSLAGSAYVKLENFSLEGDSVIVPKTVLLLGRTSAASAGLHAFKNIRVVGYSSVATVYSIASEQNVWDKPYISNDGGGALYSYYTAQSDNLSIGGLTGSSNIVHSFYDGQIESQSADASSSVIYIAGGLTSGYIDFKGTYLVAGDGAYITIETGNTDAGDFVGGPIRFTMVGGENSAGRTPLYGIRLHSASSKAIYKLTLDEVSFGSYSTNYIYTSTPNMQLIDSHIRATKTTKASVLPDVRRSFLYMNNYDFSVHDASYNTIWYDGTQTFPHWGERSSFFDISGTHPPVYFAYRYNAVSTNPLIAQFGRQRIAWHSAAPTLIAGSGASNSWRQGDMIWNTGATSGQPSGWMCITSGTFSTYSTTGGITTGTAALTVASVVGIQIGDYITIAGVTGIKQAINIVGLVVTIDSNADATVAGAAVATPDPTFAAMANLP